MSDPAGPDPGSAHPAATGLRDAAALGLSRLAQAALAVVGLKALLRVTTEYDYGRYYSFLLLANFAIAITGWPAASVLRLGAEEWSARRSLARTALLHVLLVLGSFALLGPLVWECAELLDHAFVNVPGAALIVLGYSAVTSLGNVLSALLKPAGRVTTFALLPLGTRVLWVGALVLVYELGRPLDARHVIELCALTAVPQLIAAAFLAARRTWPPSAFEAHDADRALRFGLPVLVRMVGITAFANVNFAVIKETLGVVEAGRFQVAGTLAEQTALLAVALEDLMGPILARGAARGEGRTLDTYYRTLAPQVVLAWSAACGAVVILARPLLLLLSARSVDATAGPFQVLFLATALRIVVTIEAPVFDSHLLSRGPLLFFVVAFAANLGLDKLLVPRWGIEGAAWATLGGWLLNALLRSAYLGVKFRVRPLGVYLPLAPAVLAFGWARLAGPSGALGDAAAALVLVVLTLVAGKLAGVFAPETLVALEGVRMPARLRAALTRFYGEAG